MSRPLRTALLVLAALAPVVGAQGQPLGEEPYAEPFRCDVVATGPEARFPAPSVGLVRMLVVRPRFADDPNDPPTTDADAIAAWFDRASYGAV